MHVFKKIGLVLSVALLGPVLLLGVYSYIFTQTVGDKAYVKQTIHEAGLYQAVSEAIIDKAEGQDKPEPLITNALKESFSADLIKKSLEPTIDNSYSWLEGKSEKIVFSLDLSEAKTKFSSALTKELSAKTNKLPACDYSNLPASIDVYSLECIPPGTDVKAIIKDAVSQVNESADIFTDKSVADGNISTDEAKQLGINIPTDNPASWLPKSYQFVHKGLWFFAVGTLILTVGVIFLSKTRLRGLRKAGIMLVTNGVFLLITAWLLGYLLSSLVPTTSLSATEAPVNALENVAKVLINRGSMIVRNFGIFFVAMGALGTAISTVLLRKNSDERNKLGSNKEQDVATEKPPVAQEKTPTPRQIPKE